LDYYTAPHKFVSAKQTGGAIDKLTKMPLPKHSAIELDQLYAYNRNISNILTINRKFFEEDVLEAISQVHPFYKGILQVNTDYTKLKYYEDGEYYKSHCDISRFTSVTYLYKEPKSFTGGDLYFEEFNYTIPIENNRLVLFTGCLKHASTDLKMNDEKKNITCSGYGKYTITNFMEAKD
jgi:Rps23 Pro-64 3,4-dihydroxylase Tpa1-like proline 4-hydroxylase